MSDKKINFCYLYPDSFNLHGDRGNVLAFEKTAKLMGIEFIFQRIDSVENMIDFEKTDILFISPGELRTCEGFAKMLENKKDDFKKYIDSGKIMIVVGTTIALFAKETERIDGTVFSGLNLVDALCKERHNTYSNDEIFTTKIFDESLEIIGGQIQMIDIDLNGENPLGEVKYGYGNKHGNHEGILKKHFYFTNALGPVFVKNPLLAAHVLIEALKNKHIFEKFELPAFALEHKSNEEIKKFILLKIEKFDKTRLE